ncbi:MAG: lamin tail domain-containing protein [Aggregatilineales bacterium]
MRRQSLFGFVALNLVVTIVVALGIMYGYTRLFPPPTPAQPPPLFVIITATPGTAMPLFVVVTATPGGAGGNVSVGAPVPTSESGSAPILNPSLAATLSSDQSGAGTPSTQNQGTAIASSAPIGTQTDANGCLLYTVKKGDVPGGIASDFGISLADLYQANHLKINPVLQIGQVLIIPINGCGLSTSTPTFTPTSPNTPTPPPTSSVAPTSAPSQAAVTITHVFNAGNITEEGVEVHNTSSTDTIDLSGWTLSDDHGDTFTFPTYRLFPNGSVLVNTRAGANTPRVLFWGRSTPLWGIAGTIIKLTDSTGALQANYTVGSVPG